MRENEKKQEELKASRQTLLLIPKSSGYSAAWDLYTAQSQAKLQISMNWPLLHEGKFKKKMKIAAEKSKSQNCAGTSSQGLRKLAALRNFATLAKLPGCSDSMLLFFQFLICNLI